MPVRVSEGSRFSLGIIFDSSNEPDISLPLVLLLKSFLDVKHYEALAVGNTPR